MELPKILNAADLDEAPPSLPGKLPSVLSASDLDEPPQLNAPNTSNEKPGLWHYLTSQDVSGGGKLDILGKIAQLGQFANKGNQQLAELSAEKLGQAGVPEKIAALPGTALGTASEFLMPQSRLGSLATVLPEALKGAGIAKEYAQSILGGGSEASSKPGFIANLSQGFARLRPKETQFYLNNPEEVMNAKSIPAANAEYKASIGDLKGKVQSLNQKLNKTILVQGDYDNTINRAGRLLNGTELDEAGNKIPLKPQDALDGLQSINEYLKNKEYTSKLSPQQMSSILELKDGLMDWMQNNGSPNLRKAAYEVFKAHIKDNFSKILPQNKYGSTDALRTWGTGEAIMGALGAAGGAAIHGMNPMIALPALGSAGLGAMAISPKAWGFGINNISRLGQPAVQTGLGSIIRGYNNLKNKGQ